MNGGTRDPALSSRWSAIRIARISVVEMIEPLRRAKTIGSSLEADVTFDTTDLDALPGGFDFQPKLMAELAIVAAIQAGPNAIAKTDLNKCGRCWRHLPEVTEDGDLCDRCESVVHAS